MSIEIKVPTLPESVSDAVISKWYKKVGDTIERNENLVDLETDKVMLEVPSPHAGVIEKIIIQVGATVKAHEVLAIINDKAAAASPSASTKAAAQTESKTESTEDLSPAVRRLVSEHNIDISTLKGSGKNGRITKEDVESHLNQKSQPAAAKANTSAAVSAPTLKRTLG